MAEQELFVGFKQINLEDNENRKSDSTLKVLIMNCDNRTHSDEERRYQTVKTIVNERLPHLVLVQEFDKDLWVKDDFKQYEYTYNDRTGIMYKSDLKILKSDTKHLEVTLVKIKQTSKLEPTIDINPISRMCATVMSTAAEPSFKFICISWHGPNNQEGDQNGSLLDKDRFKYFTYFMKFLGKIRENFPKDPILVGGDFNIKANVIDTHICSPFKLKYKSSFRRIKRIKDYFIFTDDLELEDTECIDLETYSRADKIFDHDPIITSVKASTSSNTEAAL